MQDTGCIAVTGHVTHHGFSLQLGLCIHISGIHLYKVIHQLEQFDFKRTTLMLMTLDLGGSSSHSPSHVVFVCQHGGNIGDLLLPRQHQRSSDALDLGLNVSP